MTDTKFELYGLYCPNTNDLKYVGITKNGLKKRLNQHLKSPTNEHMGEWVDELRKINKKPIIRQIKEFNNYEELLLGEINEINRLKKLNIHLLNVLDGGKINPMLGRKHSDKTKKIISEKKKGNIIDDETKEKIKKSLINTWNNNPDRKLKLSKIMSGKNNFFYGKKHSIDSIEKLKDSVEKRGGFDGEKNPNYKYYINKELLYKLYIVDNKTVIEISNIFNCHINTINKKLRYFGITKPKSNIYGLNIEEISKYLSKGLNYVEIGKKFGCSNKIIHKFIKKHNLYVK